MPDWFSQFTSPAPTPRQNDWFGQFNLPKPPVRISAPTPVQAPINQKGPSWSDFISPPKLPSPIVSDPRLARERLQLSLEQPRTMPAPEPSGIVGTTWNAITKPIPEYFEDFKNVPLQTGTVFDTLEGADTIARQMTSPVGIASAVLPAVGQTGAIGARAANIFNRGVGALQIGNAARNFQEGNTGAGLTDLAFGALGAIPAPRPKIPTPEPIPSAPLKVYKKIIKPAEFETGRIGANRITYRGSEPPSFETKGERTFPQSTGTPDIVIPPRLKPTTEAEAAYNAMVPERYKPQGIIPKNIETGPTGPRPYTPDAIYGEPYKIQVKPKVESMVEIKPKFKQRIVEAVSKNPETAQIVKYPQAIEEASKRLSLRDKFKRGARNVLTASIESELEKMGNAGRQIKLMLARSSALSRERASIWDEPFNQIEKNLKGKDIDEFWNAMEGVETVNPKVKAAVDVARKVDEQRKSFIEKAGVINPETGEALVPRTNYAPRIYPEGFWKNPKNVYDALLQKFPRLDRKIAEQISLGKSGTEIVDRIMASAKVDRNRAEAIARIGIEKSERKISSQFARTLNLPGYRKDFNVWREHNWDIAKKTAEQETFGRLDIADADSPISKLIEQTPNPQYTRDLVKIAIGREEKGRFGKQLESVNRAAAGLSSAMFLSLFHISNTANLLSIPLQAGMKNFSKSLLRTLVTARGDSKAMATESGALYNITRGILEAQQSNKVSKVFGITSSENLNRTVAAGAGRAAARDLFETLKAGKLNPKNAKFLEDLVLDNPEKLLKQTELTEQQLRFAGGRMAELTQGLGEARKVPVYWSSPYWQLPLIFKKYAFQQTGIIKDAIKRDPVRTIPMLLVGSQIMGELVGSTKAAVIGGVKAIASGDASALPEKIERRGEYLGEYLPDTERFGISNRLTQRVVDNIMQSWALGLFADLFFLSTSDARGMAYDLMGPALGTALTGAEAARKAIGGEPAMLGRETLRRIPFVGRGIQEAILPTRYQQNLDKKRELPAMVAPPSFYRKP